MTLGTLNVAPRPDQPDLRRRPDLRAFRAGEVPAASAQIPLSFLGQFGAIPVSALVLLVAYGGVAFFLRKTAVGRHVVAVGGNPQAARVSGINVDRHPGARLRALRLLRRARRAAVSPGAPIPAFRNAGIGAELDAIAAVIIGGASFFGGRGTVLGVFAGVLIMGLLRNGLNLMNVSVFWQQLLIGLIIILAV